MPAQAFTLKTFEKADLPAIHSHDMARPPMACHAGSFLKL